MAYQKMDHGEGTPRLNPQSTISFIEFPDGYKKATTPTFKLWESGIPYLQFDEGSVYLNAHRKTLKMVEPGSEHYDEIKSIVDLLNDS